MVPLLVYYKAYSMRGVALRNFTSLSEDINEENLDISFSFEVTKTHKKYLILTLSFLGQCIFIYVG